MCNFMKIGCVDFAADFFEVYFPNPFFQESLKCTVKFWLKNGNFFVLNFEDSSKNLFFK